MRTSASAKRSTNFSQQSAAHSILYISNISEDIWTFVQHMQSAKERSFEINENAFLSDRDLLAFGGVDNVTMVLPHQVDPDFLHYYLDVFGNKNFKVLVPAKHTGRTSLDLANDKALMKELVTQYKNKNLMVASYSTSAEFLQLVDALQASGVNCFTPQAPENAQAWTVNFFGSKGGFRQLVQQHISDLHVSMAPGMITLGREQTAAVAAAHYHKYGGVVLKTNKGHAGAGLLIFKPGQLKKSYQACYNQIITELEKEPYWESSQTVVEQYIDIDPNIGGGNPNVELRISESGKVEILYYCGMRVTKHGVFMGVEINHTVLPARITDTITAVGTRLGELYAEYGYRGYFEFDFVADKTGKLFLTESNVRRTGGTHVYHAAVALLGSDFFKTSYVLSTNLYTLPTRSQKPRKATPPSFSKIYSLLKPVLFDRQTKQGVVIAAANLLQNNQIAYMVLGKNKQSAVAIEKKMQQLLQTMVD